MIVLNVRWEDRVAVEDAETGEQIRYGELRGSRVSVGGWGLPCPWYESFVQVPTQAK